MKRPRYVVEILILTLCVPALVLAQSVSIDTPNDIASPLPAHNVPGAGPQGAMKVIVNVNGPNGVLPKVDTGAGSIALIGGDLGQNVASLSANQVCTKAVAAGYACSGFLNLNPATTCVGGNGLANDCCTQGAATRVDYNCIQGNPAGGFSISRVQNDIKFGISAYNAVAGSFLRGVNKNTNAGNTLGDDPLPYYLVGIVPNGVGGVVTFRVFHAQGGTNPRTFTVNTSSFLGDPVGLANAIVTGFQGTGLGLQAEALGPGHPLSLYTENSAEFQTSVPVRLASTNTLSDIQVSGLPGQTIIQEDNAFPVVPALSPWGIAALVVTLLLTSLWFLRRRVRMA
jgi:hypothetical protein